MMNLSEKIIHLRKIRGWSQEKLAEELHLSRQSVSRWENGSAQPDAANILQLSNLFEVSADYLLRDELDTDQQVEPRNTKSGNLHSLMIFMLTLEVMALIMQFLSAVILQNTSFTVLSFVPFAAIIGGFEYAYRKQSNQNNSAAGAFRRKFYKISTWLGAYFPIRFLVSALAVFYPRPYSPIVLEGVIVILYLMAATLICLLIRRDTP